MTVLTETSRATFAWTGVETAFACGFPADKVADLQVFFTDDDGVQSQLTYNVHFSATLASGTKIATVLPIALPPAPGDLVVQRRTPSLVSEVLADGQEFSLAVIQRMFDRLAMSGAEFRTQLARAIVLAEGVELGDGNFDLGGSGLSNMAPGTAPSDAATVSQLLDLIIASGNVPAPLPGDVDRFLVATGPDTFAWLALVLAQIPNGLFTADADGLAKFADGFLTADAAGRAKMAAGFLSADATGRAKMAAEFLLASQLSASARALATPINLGLSCSVATGALTVALTDAAGAALAAGNPAIIPFRSVNAGEGTLTTRLLTAATTLTISSGSTLGVAAINTPFALWLVAFDDAGTVRLGIINSYDGSTIYPLQPGGLASSTAEGGAGAADSAQIFYTGAAVAAKAYQVLARLEWSTGLATLGTWTVPSRVDLFAPGMPMPGSGFSPVYVEYTSAATLSATIPLDNTTPQSSEGTQILSAPKTLTSAANKVRAAFRGYGGSSAGVVSMIAALFRGGASAICTAVTTTGGANHRSDIAFDFLDAPGSTSLLTYTLRIGPNLGSMALNGVDGVANMNGTSRATLSLEEVMT